MPEGLPFNKNDLPRINTNLLFSLIAQQQALVDAFLEHLVSPEMAASILKRAEELYPGKQQSVLGHLYTQYGMTPDVLKPDDDSPKAP